MANRTADDQRELRYHEKQIEFSRRWYEAHVVRAEADLDHSRLRQSEGQRGAHVDGPEASVYKFLEFVTGQRLPASSGEREAGLAELVADIDEDASRFERVAIWWDEKKPVFLDPVLVGRCDYGFNNRNKASIEGLKSNADAMVAIASYLGTALVKDLSNITGHQLRAHNGRGI